MTELSRRFISDTPERPPLANVFARQEVRDGNICVTSVLHGPPNARFNEGKDRLHMQHRDIQDIFKGGPLASEILRFYGVRINARRDNNSETLDVVAPQDVENYNTGLRRLGLHDRQFAHYEGGIYSLTTLLENYVEGTVLLASAAPDALHDRITHSPALALLPPEFFAATQPIAADYLRQLRQVEEGNTFEASVIGAQAKELARKLDIVPPLIVQEGGLPSGRKVIGQIYETFFSVFGVAHAQELADATLRHRRLIIERLAD